MGIETAGPGLLAAELGSLDVLERMGVPVIVTRIESVDSHPRIEFANEAALQFLGYESEELLGQGPEFWQASPLDVVDLRAIASALSAGRKVRTATVSRAKDGTERALRIEMVPQPGATGTWVVNTVLWVSDEDPEDTGSIRIPKQPVSELKVGNLVLDRTTYRVAYGDAGVELTPSESILLATLMEQAGCVVERTLIFEELWGVASGNSRAVDVYIAALRRKLQEIGAHELIHTVRGVGYLLQDE